MSSVAVELFRSSEQFVSLTNQMTVADLLRSKGRRVFTIDVEASVYDAIALMVEHNVGSLVVLDAKGLLAGIFTERDYLRKIVIQGRTSKGTLVRDVMTTDPVCVDPDHTIAQVMSIMTQRRVRRLPVIKQGRLVGLISVGDVIKAVADEQVTHIRRLSDYISGRYPG